MPDPAPTSDIAALIERLCDIERDFGAAARMGDAENAAKATVEAIHTKRAVDTALAAQQDEIERLRATINETTDEAAGWREDARRAESALAARDETIRGLKERVRRLAQLANTGDSPKAQAERAAERARTAINSTEPSND